MSASIQYTSIHLYRKMMDCALAEGISVGFFDQFPDKTSIDAWFNDPEYQEAMKFRHALSKMQLCY